MSFKDEILCHHVFMHEDRQVVTGIVTDSVAGPIFHARFQSHEVRTLLRELPAFEELMQRSSLYQIPYNNLRAVALLGSKRGYSYDWGTNILDDLRKDDVSVRDIKLVRSLAPASALYADVLPNVDGSDIPTFSVGLSSIVLDPQAFAHFIQQSYFSQTTFPYLEEHFESLKQRFF